MREQIIDVIFLAYFWGQGLSIMGSIESHMFELRAKGQRILFSSPGLCLCAFLFAVFMRMRILVRSKLHEFSIHAIIRHSKRILDLAMLTNKDLWLHQYN